MRPGRRAEAPHPGLPVAGEQAPADQLVAGPLADDGAGDVADVVLVEHEERAEAGASERLAGAPQAVGVQAPEVDALLEVHLHAAGRLDGPVPAMLGVDGIGRDGAGLDGGLTGHGASSAFARL